MADEEVKPRLIIEEAFKAGKFAHCDDCWESVEEGTVMHKARYRWMTQRTDNFKSLDGRELSVDLRLNICQKCVERNDLKQVQRNDPNRKEKLATSKEHYKDKRDKQKALNNARQKKKRDALPKEEGEL